MHRWSLNKTRKCSKCGMTRTSSWHGNRIYWTYRLNRKIVYGDNLFANQVPKCKGK